LLDKEQFHSWAETERWPVPRSWIIRSTEDLERLAPQISYPAILKPQIKNSAFRASFLPKAFRVETQNELKEAYLRVSPHEQVVIVQQWIDGADDRIAFALGYWSRESRPLGLFFGRKIRQWPIGSGNTAHAEPAPGEWVDLMRPLVEQIGSICGFQGLNSVEFKIDPDGKRLYITEPTVCRTDYQSEVAVVNGVNLPALAYYDALADNPPQSALFEERPEPVKWIDGRADFRAGKKLFKQGQLSLTQWLGSYRGNRSFVYLRMNDPLPWLGRMMPDRIAYRLRQRN
jgi:predicted ATP-grasp superfamily ATP-dependent carboligase